MDINTAQETPRKPEMVGDEHLIVRRKLGIENTVQAGYESKIKHWDKIKIENRTECRWNKSKNSRLSNRRRGMQNQERKDKLKHNRFEQDQAKGNHWPLKIGRGVAQPERTSIEHWLSTVQTAQVVLVLNQNTVTQRNLRFVLVSWLWSVRGACKKYWLWRKERAQFG